MKVDFAKSLFVTEGYLGFYTGVKYLEDTAKNTSAAVNPIFIFYEPRTNKL